MKKYLINLPITGYISIEVKAENEEMAIDKAFESEECNLDNLIEWEACKSVCEGNVCYAILTDVVAEEI